MESDTEELACRIARALEPLEAVRVAWLFGSRARGTARHDSDLDIGVVYGRELDGWARELLRRQVFVRLTDELGSIGERADIVDLLGCDGAVAFNAIRQGRLVLARSESERVATEVSIGRRYDDETPKRMLFRRAAIEAGRRLAEETNA